MPTRGKTVLGVRVDEPFKRAFAEAAQREGTTAVDLVRCLMRDFVLDSRRREAERQSAVVVAATDADADESMDSLMHA